MKKRKELLENLKDLIKASTNSLPARHREPVEKLVHKICKGQQLKVADVKLLGLDFDHCLGKHIQEAFGIGHATISNWQKQGCPRNDDGTYSLQRMVEWHRTQYENKLESNTSKKSKEELKKIETQNKILEARHSEMTKKSIPVQVAMEIQKENIIELRNFLTDGWKRNSQEMCSVIGVKQSKIGKFNSVMDEFIKEAINSFTKSGLEYETEIQKKA